jgi:hypothetical protein
VRDDQHAERADAHHQVAQPQRERGTHHRLHQRRVGGQARQHLAGLRRLEELRALFEHVGVDGVAQVRRDAFAQPADHVEARGGEQSQRDRHAEQREEVLPHGEDALSRRRAKPLVDEPAQRHREHQHRGGGEAEEHDGQRDAAPVGLQERQQSREGLRLARGRGGGGGHWQGV